MKHKIKKGAKRTLLLLVVYLELYPLSRTSALLIRSNSNANIHTFFCLPKYTLKNLPLKLKNLLKKINIFTKKILYLPSFSKETLTESVRNLN